MLVAQNKPTTDEEHHRTTERDYWKSQLRLTKWLTWITGAGVVGGVVSLLLLKCTLDATWETLRVSERAYVGIDQIEIDRKQGIIVLSLRNTGKVPAQWVRGFIHASCNIPGKAIRSSEEDFFTMQAVISPGPSIYIYKVALRLKKPREEEEFCTSTQDEWLGVGGKISYEDGFGSRETFPYCFRYAPSLPGQWIICPVGTREERREERRRMKEEEKSKTQNNE